VESQFAKSTNRTVLIVDHDFTIRLMARETLEQTGFDVADTDDGGQALDFFERINPEIILLDVRITGSDGFEICRQIREHPKGGNTPILMMTGLHDTDSIKRAYQTGATDIIAKPCNMQVLSQRVSHMMQASHISKSRASLIHAQRIAKIGSWEWDIKGDLMIWSEATYHIFPIDKLGFDRSYHSFLNSLGQHDNESEPSVLEEALSNNRQLSIDHQIMISDGPAHHLHTEAKVICDNTGSPVWVTGTVQDVTERKQNEERIKKLAYYDSLTGLPNRVLFKENLARVLGRAEENGMKIAIMFLDMDHFKEINDTMGHDIGDKLLQGFAGRLAHCCRKTDRKADRSSDSAESNSLLARLGGDEFTVILDNISRIEDAATVARRIVDTTTKPFDFDGCMASVTVSIGISIYPDDGTDVETLLKCADIAMYQAKNQGRNNFHYQSPSEADGLPGVGSPEIVWEKPSSLKRNKAFELSFTNQVCC
jgi:diguanylate cyclase (GGDEF)-like protein